MPVIRGIEPKISVSFLPRPGRSFVGRGTELKCLDEAWQDIRTNVVEILAFGGVGKSALVSNWLIGLRSIQWGNAEFVFGFSFHSQGDSAASHTSSDAFFSEASRFFGCDASVSKPPQQKAMALVECLRRHRTALVLDGIEPLQYPPTHPRAGSIRDVGLATLIQEIAVQNKGLCLLSTRISVRDIQWLDSNSSVHGSVLSLKLSELSSEVGAEVLAQLGVWGLDEDLQNASRQVRGHALSVSLLGNYIHRAFGGDIRKLPEIELWKADDVQGGHTKRLLQKYEEWFSNSVEHSLLRVIGLFDQPMEREALAIFQKGPAIPGLTDHLVDISTEKLRFAISSLVECGLFLTDLNADASTIDAHPLVREYFAIRLSANPNAVVAGHSRLFDFFCQCPWDLPESASEAMSLFRAIRHGIRCGRRAHTFKEVYVRRLDHGGQYWAWLKLGLYGLTKEAMREFMHGECCGTDEVLPPESRSVILNHLGMACSGTLEMAAAVAAFSEVVRTQRQSVRLRTTASNEGNRAAAARYLGNWAIAMEAAEGGISDFDHYAIYDSHVGNRDIEWLHGLRLRLVYGRVLLDLGYSKLANQVANAAVHWYRKIYRNADELFLGETSFYLAQIKLAEWTDGIERRGWRSSDSASLVALQAKIHSSLSVIVRQETPARLDYAVQCLASSEILVAVMRMAVQSKIPASAASALFGIPQDVTWTEFAGARMKQTARAALDSCFQPWIVEAKLLELRCCRLSHLEVPSSQAIEHFQRCYSELNSMLMGTDLFPTIVDLHIEGALLSRQTKEAIQFAEHLRSAQKAFEKCFGPSKYVRYQSHELETPEFIRAVHKSLDETASTPPVFSYGRRYADLQALKQIQHQDQT